MNKKLELLLSRHVKTLPDGRIIRQWRFTRVVRISSFLRAILGKRITRDQQANRLKICVGCPFMEQLGANQFCKACGCGHKRLARLHVKVKFKNAVCPKGLWPRFDKP